eukprot:GEMP01017271.1.p1 GENE.GEMP01017271.1~~GEMP01017271.1.p1  ORF type:complete len:295 (+),score=40.24 GEMP01017271.1:758-1642(+)
MARHHLLRDKGLNGALRCRERGTVMHFGKRRTGRCMEFEGVEIEHWWIQLRLTGKKAKGKFLWMLMAWHRSTAWKCVFVKGHYSEAAGMCLLVETAPTSSLWLARQRTGRSMDSVHRYLLTAPRESTRVTSFLRGAYIRRRNGDCGRRIPVAEVHCPSVRDRASTSRPVWERGYHAIGSCLYGQGVKDIWVVKRDKYIAIAVHITDGRVALAQVDPRGVPRASSVPIRIAPVTRVWGGRSTEGRFLSYRNRLDVPRAHSIEAVVPMEDQIAVYYKARAGGPMQLWRVDAKGPLS